VAVVMLVAEPTAGEPVLGPAVARQIATQGVARASLLRDGSSIGIVLEGWAFDPASFDEVIRVLFPDRYADVRVFHEVERIVVVPESAGKGVS